MTKGFWGILMLVSLCVTIVSGAYVFKELKEKQTLEVTLQKISPKEESSNNPATAQEDQTKSHPTPEENKNLVVDKIKPEKSQSVQSSLEHRNILFSLFTAAGSVFIVGDFNNWYREPLVNEKGKLWTAAKKIKPGTYEYRYIIDGKRVKDPNNSKVSQNGNSILVVKPLTKS